MERDEAEEKIVDAYEQWLMDHCADELHTKDQLIEASENGFRSEEFIEYVKNIFGGESNGTHRDNHIGLCKQQSNSN